jgi:hypothetical protein
MANRGYDNVTAEELAEFEADRLRDAEFEAMCLREYGYEEDELDEHEEHYESHGAENDYSAGEVLVAKHVRLMAHATQRRLEHALDQEMENSAIGRRELLNTLAGSDPLPPNDIRHHELALWDKHAAVRRVAAEDALLRAVDVTDKMDIVASESGFGRRHKKREEIKEAKLIAHIDKKIQIEVEKFKEQLASGKARGLQRAL